MVFCRVAYHFHCHTMAIFTVFKQTLLKNILNMKHYFVTSVGRLRLLAFIEGISLLVLIFVAVPMKHFFDNPVLVKVIGPVHGALFLLFIFNTLRVGVEEGWKFRATTWKVLLACIVPFGTFYIDYSILRRIDPGG